MHLVSNVVGKLRPGTDGYDVLAATFPAGTLSGAPKPRALSLLDELEPYRRGIYGGVVGYLDFTGDMDMAIAIRSALIKGNRAYVQAGGGIVADSDLDAEALETINKSAAPLRAVWAAGTMAPAQVDGTDI
jgi:anthranilate synthase component 1